MQVKAIKNLIYGGAIIAAGTLFECEEKSIIALQKRGLVEGKADFPSAEIAGLPSLNEELKRKKR